MTDTEQNKAVYRRWLEECWSGDDSDLQGDIDLQDRLVDVDVVDHNPVPGVPTGLDGQRAVLGMYRAAFDIETKLDLLLADGDHVAGRWTARFIHKGDFMGIPPTGKQATVTGMNIARFRNEKIVEFWHQEDVMSLMRQLGVLPVPAGSVG
jgi:predicted ester cyclase